MKIIVVGGNGTLGSTVVSHLAKDHEIIIAGRSYGDVKVDLSRSSTILDMFEKVGKVDAVICTAGEAKWAALDSLSEEDFHIGINNKLMGQINLVRIGRKYVNPGGSITLTTGILGDDPVPGTAAASLVNGAIHSFVKAVVLEIKNGVRVNVVAPGLVEDSYKKYKDYFPGYNPVPMDKVVNGYIRSLFRGGTGEIIRIY